MARLVQDRAALRVRVLVAEVAGRESAAMARHDAASRDYLVASRLELRELDARRARVFAAWKRAQVRVLLKKFAVSTGHVMWQVG